jgi:ABC-type branched-subunit amino acid transport system ATPase component
MGREPAFTRRLLDAILRQQIAVRRHVSIVIVEHNLDLVLALADRVFARERGAVFHQGPAQPLLTNLDYR